MPGLLSKLLGARVLPTSANIGAEIETRKAALAKAQGVVAAAAQARARALDDLDADGMARADDAAAAGGRAVEIEERALVLLDDAHAKAVEAEQAAARAATVAALVDRRRALASRLDGDWKRAAAVLAEVIGEAATLARDISEAKAEREVERLPEIARRAACINSLAAVSTYLGDSLSAFPVVPESAKERDSREHQAKRERERAERDAESARMRKERGAENLRNRETEERTGRNPGEKVPVEIFSDPARAPWWSAR